MNNDMIELIKLTMPEIDLKLSNKIIEKISDVQNISNSERESIIHIMDTYMCSYDAIENFRKYIRVSYYKQIDGKKYDRSLLLLAENLIKGKGDGRISEDDMKKLLKSSYDNNKITDCEKDTLHYICENFKCTDKAKKYLDMNISN
tara:strand:+ start:1891 stop:2328 length:438 start_codon:yes stop_codon:yes gene_type:complete